MQTSKNPSRTDYTTIDMERLERLGEYDPPPSYHVDRHAGSACFGEPPGHPSYLIRHVYTRYGNMPRRGVAEVITGPDGRRHPVRRGDDPYAKLEVTLRSLFRPLPVDHPRTRLWIRAQYRHFGHCYADPDRPEYGRPGTLIYPLQDWQKQHFEDDPRFSEEYRAKETAAVAQANADEEARARRLATPENHRAVLVIREYYPDYQPEQDLIDNPPDHLEGQWWETEATQPTPEECYDRSLDRPHQDDWCQWCGRRAKESPRS